MSERPPEQPEQSLDTSTIGDKSLRYWHAFLTTDHETGQDTSHLEVPASRYGRTSGEVAYWALAAAMVLEHANGIDEPEITLDGIMSDVVNDQPDVATIVHDYLWLIPSDLQDYLDWDQVNEG